MAEAFGPVYQLTATGTIFDQEFANVWYYCVFEGEGGDADPLGVAFKIGVLNNLKAIQSVAVEYLNLQILGARDSTEVADIDISDVVGQVAGDCLPPYAAWSYIITRSSTSMRNGFKRFPGVAESWNSNGEVTTGTPSTTVHDLGADLKADLELSTGRIATLVVPKRQWHSVPVSPVEYWTPADVNFNGISTQNTRKFGR